MKTIEAAIIFPFTLLTMVSLIFLSFKLHDMILYKAASYKYLICNEPNSADYNISEESDSSLLEKYIYNFSLTHNAITINKTKGTIDIESSEYSGTINCSYYDKCDLLRKCSVASDIIDKIKTD